MRPDPLVEEERELLRCCPECGSNMVVLRTGGRGDEDVAAGSYRCEHQDCRARFDEPDWREPEKKQPVGVGGLHPLAEKLIEMDPDDWPPEDQELVSDGGRQRFWVTRVFDGPPYQDDLLALECNFCSKRHEEDPFANHSDDCPVSEDWVDEQRERVEELPGIGPTGADRLLREYGSADRLLEELCRADPGPHAGPLRIVRLNGFGVDSARKLVEGAHRTGLCDDVEERTPELATDGGEDPMDVVMDLCRFFHLKEVGNTAKADDVDGELATAIFEIQAAAYGHAAEECWRAAQYLRGELERPPAVRIGRENRSDDLEPDPELATDGAGPDWSPYRAANGAMEEVSFRAPTEMLEEIDERIEAGEYKNRSEAIRQAVNHLLSRPKRVRTDGGKKGRHG